MNVHVLSRRRIVGVASLLLVTAAIVTSAALPAAAAPAAVSTCPSGAPVLQLANPNPGDLLSQGDYLFSGVAFDPAATDGSGIARVDLFLGQRDSGGLFLASTAPGQTVAMPSNGHLFEVEATVPSNANGSRDFVAYAYSSVTGQETSVTVPVFIGAAPTPTPTGSTGPAPAPLTETVRSSCSGSTSVAPTPVVPTGATSAFQPLPAAGVRSAPVLELANPSFGDVLSTGDLIVEGIAYDPTAGQGDGVDRVELFLDSRDSGGTILGSGVPADSHHFRIKASLPSNASGGHSFVAYAHSSVTDQESVTSVPVFVGTAPTPTPRPKN